ncbi:Branchpoint-bridging protein [Penicillium canariense]|uniref:Branchpoint-bridging protein n=1 Tax=Penicillium canariense TaxID=189055 RepID=A0A9W9LS40_9EURO|nr:Branchpoint-bridging protein [Penicillium canariense]KAJ5174663.1 Branchpoint-bridging protein [Penicillium canariense]
MAWRNQGITGSNNIPLGSRRRFTADEEDESRTATPSSMPDGPKRGRSPVRGTLPFSEKCTSAISDPIILLTTADPPDDGVKRRKKRNRWGDQQENKAAGLMGLPTMIMANFTSEQLEAYTLHLRIEEISQKLRINDVVPADGDRYVQPFSLTTEPFSHLDRSPSPPPQYDNFGRRVNTREYRYRKRLEDERHKLIEKAMKTIPNYHPPSDYRRPTKTQEKVYVPVNDYPEINFIGLLIGPRGNTLKKMETESGAKIAIRGKGSVKEGKGRSDAAHASNQEEDLHCLIMADTEEKVNKAKKLVHNVIETAASIPEGQNELKRNQLRELAALNGTLRDDENQACQNCESSQPHFPFIMSSKRATGGQIGHRKYDCPEQRNFTTNIICRVCGNAGHMARDCPDRQRGSDWRNGGGIGGGQRNPRAVGTGDAVDREMEQLMNELSGGAPGEYPPRRIEAGPDQGGYPDDRDEKPWQRGPPPPSDVAPWQQRREQRPRDDYGSRDQGPAPWAAQNRSSNDYGYGSQGGYAAPGTAPGAAPWQQQAPPGDAAAAAGYGYGAYAGYAYPPGMAAPGMAAPPPPPGMAPMGGYGGAGSPPPPPPGEGPPPPPPSDQPPPPPPA